MLFQVIRTLHAAAEVLILHLCLVFWRLHSNSSLQGTFHPRLLQCGGQQTSRRSQGRVAASARAAVPAPRRGDTLLQACSVPFCAVLPPCGWFLVS